MGMEAKHRVDMDMNTKANPRMMEEEIVNEGFPPQGLQGDQVPLGNQGNQVPVDPPAMTTKEVRSTLLMIAQAITTQAQAMTAQATRGVEANVNPNCLVGTSGCYGCGKNDYQVKDCPTLTARGREAKQASLSGPNLDAPKRNHFYAIQAIKDK
uniref:Gag-pol polyprotein n=1 Tax=Solanum tuberosum TaxID=4113 RepID=M1DJ17_SOLTU